MDRTGSAMIDVLPRRAEASPAVLGPLELAVIVPTFNECGNVAALVARLDVVLAGRQREIIFVDDASTDGTPAAILALAAARRDVRVIRRFGRRGLSSAVIEGILSTAAPVVAVMDGDLQHDERILPQLYEAVRDGADLAVGTRYGDGGSLGDWTAGRSRLSALATWLVQATVKTPLSDPLSGFFAVRQALVVANHDRLSNLGFKILLDIVIAAPGRLAIAEVPYAFRSRHSGESKLDTLVTLEFVLLLLDKYLGRWIPPRLVIFLIIGTFGLGLNLVLLDIFLLHAGLGFRGAQALAVAITIAVNFTLNNQLTYRDRRLHGGALWRGLAAFYLVCGLGAVANVGAAQFVYAIDRRWWLAGVAGAAISAIWNYAASSFLTWRNR